MIPPLENPFDLFREWYALACQIGLAYPHAMSLATVGEELMPSVRVVLLKDFDEKGFVFYTNTMSRKGREIAQNPCAALCFYWEPIGRQVRIRGNVEPVTIAEADAYFATRPRGSRIGAWASLQSETLPDRETLLARVDEYERKFPGEEVPRPQHWSGYRLAPIAMEFWLEGEFRLHHRREYALSAEGRWENRLLYP